MSRWFLPLRGSKRIGKSSLAMQMTVSWALGKEVFGIKPVKPLKSLLIQAENDFGDVSEMLRGTLGGLGIKTPEEATSALRVPAVPSNQL